MPANRQQLPKGRYFRSGDDPATAQENGLNERFALLTTVGTFAS